MKRKVCAYAKCALRVREVAYARHKHWNICCLGGCDNFFVTHASTWLNDCGNTCVEQDLQSIGEREERVTCSHARLAAISGTTDSETSRINAVDLTRKPAKPNRIG